jgi:hypothetical protein
VKSVLLIMRKGWRIHGDHIDTLRRLGFEIHLLTEVTAAHEDPRFSSATIISRLASEDAVAIGVALCRRIRIEFAITFQETDIEICSRICDAIGAKTVPVFAADTARDKSCATWDTESEVLENQLFGRSRLQNIRS